MGFAELRSGFKAVLASGSKVSLFGKIWSFPVYRYYYRRSTDPVFANLPVIFIEYIIKSVNFLCIDIIIVYG